MSAEGERRNPNTVGIATRAADIQTNNFVYPDPNIVVAYTDDGKDKDCASARGEQLHVKAVTVPEPATLAHAPR
jgi:hypothetical protein